MLVPAMEAERSGDRSLRGSSRPGFRCVGAHHDAPVLAGPYGEGGPGLNAARDRKGSFQPGRVKTP